MTLFQRVRAIAESTSAFVLTAIAVYITMSMNEPFVERCIMSAAFVGMACAYCAYVWRKRA